MNSETEAAKGACCGAFRTWLAMSGKANVGPKTTIAPMTCRNRNSWNMATSNALAGLPDGR